MKSMTRRLLLIVLSASLLTGCGFALRGSVNIPPSLKTVVIIGVDRDIIDMLEDALETSGATIASTDNPSASVIDLAQVDYEREVRTTDANGLATSYTLRYRVGYDVRDSQGDELQVNQKIVQRRFFDYDPLQELQSEEEEQFLREEMQEEVVLQILRRLSRIAS